MPRFIRRSRLPVDPAALFAWHERPGAFERLVPGWSPVRLLSRTGDGIRDGARVELRVPIGPVGIRWLVEHRGYVAGERFQDVQLRGPFARWIHTHRMLPAEGGALLEDEIDYALPLGPLGALGGGWLARRELARLFDYRHAVTAADLERHAAFADRGPLRFAITGATGFVGRALTSFLTTGGHQVVRLTRQPRAAGDAHWDPARGELDPRHLDGADVVIHLAGEPVSERWTEEHKRAIRESRAMGTRLLAQTLARLHRKPSTLVSASAIGYYGDGGDTLLTEDSPAGSGFLPTVAREWESAAEPAAQAGIRVVHPRLGVVLSPAGGALAKLLPPFQLGGGGKIGSGTQWMSWIDLDDTIGALHHLALTPAVEGPVNVVAPHPVTNADFSHTLAHVLGRPALMTVPPFALRLLFGEMADEVLLAGQRVSCARLTGSGFTFRHPELEGALRYELGKGNG